MTEKIINLNSLQKILKPLKKTRKTIVFTNGSFDIMHAGHVTYLNEAKKRGEVLIVGVNSDESIKKYKSKDRPINKLSDRMTVLAALSCVDYVIAFNETTPTRLIEIIEPDIFVKGGDYAEDNLIEANVIKLYGGDIQILPFVKGRSTTNIITKILNTYAS